MSTTEEKGVEKVPWIPLVLLTAFLSFLAIVSYRFLIAVGNGTQCVYNFGVISQTVFLGCILRFSLHLFTLSARD